MKLRSLLRRFVVAIGVLLVLVQVIRPARTNPAIDRARTLEATGGVPADVAAILDRSCRDCHSNETRWPWYSNVAPISWFVIDHVNHGRSHLNFSDWARYTTTEADKLMADSCDLVRRRAMPMRSYTWMHAEARLSIRDIEAICTGLRPAAID